VRFANNQYTHFSIYDVEINISLTTQRYQTVETFASIN